MSKVVEGIKDFLTMCFGLVVWKTAVHIAILAMIAIIIFFGLFGWFGLVILGAVFFLFGTERGKEGIKSMQTYLLAKKERLQNWEMPRWVFAIIFALFFILLCVLFL